MYTQAVDISTIRHSGNAEGTEDILTSADVVDVFIRMRVKLERLLVSRTGCRHVAKDLFQDLYFRVRLIERAFNTDSDVQHYLVRMTINAAIDHNRGEARRADLLARSEIIFIHEPPTPEEVLARTDHFDAIDEVLDGLPTKCRMILFLSQINGMTHAEIADELGVSRSLVEKYKVLAISACRARLDS